MGIFIHNIRLCAENVNNREKRLSPVRDLLRTKWADRGIKLGSLVKGAVIEDDWGIKKRSTFFLKSIFLRKSLRLALTRPTSLYKGGCFPQKDGRRVRVSPNKFIYTKRKSTKEKSLCFFWRRRRDSTGFQPVVFALRTVYFMSLFAPQKDGRRVRVSPNKFIYTKRKSTKEKSLCFFWRRRRDSNSRAGYPTYALSRGASSPTWVLLHW